MNNNNYSNDHHDMSSNEFYGGEHQQHSHNNMDMSMTKTSQGAFASSMKMNSSLDMSQYAQLTRHARRIYVGGIPPNYADEEIIRNFLNSVIAKGMGEENDNSYVISIYANQKKCFAFVEVKSIELASACLDLDGIIFKKIVLKILRANEYKPDLVTPAMLGKPIRLDLSSFAFGSANIPNFQAPNSPLYQTSSNIPQQHQQSPLLMQQQQLQLQSPNQYNNNNLSNSSMSNHSTSNHSMNSMNNVSMHNMSMNRIDMGFNPDVSRSEGGMSEHHTHNHQQQPLRLDSIIQFSSLTGLDPGSIVIVGFPYDDPQRRGGAARGMGCHAAPKCMRGSIRKFRYGSVQNPEYGVDLSTVKFVDVGDVLAGKSGEETRANLATTVSELVLRGGIPYVVGGSGDQSCASVQGLIAVTGGNVGVLTISASLEHNILLLEDGRFCGFRNESKKSPNTLGSSTPTCEGRYVAFAAQGSQSTVESANFTTERGGQIVWLSRDLRNSSLKSSAVAQFKTALKSLSVNALTGVTRPVAVCLDMGALCSSASPFASSSHSPVGLSMEEALEMITIAGMNSNVALFDVTEFSPEAEDSRANMIMAELFYRFSMGVASRIIVTTAVNPQQAHQQFQNTANVQHQTAPYFQQQPHHSHQVQLRDRSNSNLSSGGQQQHQQQHEMHLHNAGGSRGSSNNSSTQSNPSGQQQELSPFSPQQQQHQQHQHFMPSSYISDDLHARRPPGPVHAVSHKSDSTGSNSSMYSNFTTDSSFTTNSGGSNANMHAHVQAAQGRGSPLTPGISRTASGLSGYPPHQQQHQAIPMSPRRTNSLANQQVTSGIGGVAMANFFTAGDGQSLPQAQVRPAPLLHEFSARTSSLSKHQQQHDFSQSMANMSVGDLHQFDEALDLNLNYNNNHTNNNNTLYAPAHMASPPQQHQNQLRLQQQQKFHQRMETQNSLTLSEEDDGDSALPSGLSRDMQLLVSDSPSSGQGVENVQESSSAAASQWTSLPPGL